MAIPSSQLLQEGRELVRQETSMGMGPLPYFICWKMGSVIRSNAVWNTIMVDKHSISPQRVALKNNAPREGKPVPTISILVKTKHFSFYEKRV